MDVYTLWLTLDLLLVTAGFTSGSVSDIRGLNPGQFLAVRRNTTRRFDTDHYLEKYGYLEKAPPNAQRSPEARIAAIKTFQRMSGLRVTGRLDRATRRKMLAPRCGNPDVVREVNAQGEPQGQRSDGQSKSTNFYLTGHKWRKTSLSWKILNSSPDMDPALQRRAFANGLRYWSEVSGLRFVEKTEGDADITVQFASGNHGDGAINAFDEKGGVLAHAFYPEDGAAHFDEAELWSATGSRHAVHLETVAAHEFGHALGLGHSGVPGSLMAPFYKGYNPNLRLHQDDIQAIQSLYGAQPATPTPGIAPTEESSGPESGIDMPKVCTMKYDAIVQSGDGGIYVFRENQIWKLNTWALESGYPVAADTIFNRLPNNIGAAVYSPSTKYTYFFKGRAIYKYYGSHRIGHLTLQGQTAPISPQAAFLSRDGNIYVLQGPYLWRFDEYEEQYVGVKTRISAKYPGLPANIEAAVRLQDGFLYAIKGDKYRKYDEFGRRMMPGYPRDKAGPFMGPKCGGRFVPK